MIACASRSPGRSRREPRGRYGRSSQDGRSRDSSAEPAYRYRSRSPQTAGDWRDPAGRRSDALPRDGWSSREDEQALPDPPQQPDHAPLAPSTQDVAGPNVRASAANGTLPDFAASICIYRS